MQESTRTKMPASVTGWNCSAGFSNPHRSQWKVTTDERDLNIVLPFSMASTLLARSQYRGSVGELRRVHETESNTGNWPVNDERRHRHAQQFEDASWEVSIGGGGSSTPVPNSPCPTTPDVAIIRPVEANIRGKIEAGQEAAGEFLKKRNTAELTELTIVVRGGHWQENWLDLA